MKELVINKEMLRFVFSRLRAQEGITKGNITKTIGDEMIFKILINTLYKKDKNMILTELETAVKKENGNFIFMYVSQKWDEVKKNYSSIPFDELAKLSIKDLPKLTPLKNQIA